MTPRRPPVRSGKRRPTSGVRFGALAGSPRPAGPELEAEVAATAYTRSRVALAALAVAMVGLIARAGWLMTIPNSYIEEHGRELYQAAVDLHGERGAIVDKQGRILAWTVDLPSLYVNAAKFPQDQVDTVAPLIAELTGRTLEDVQKRLRNTASREFRLGDGLDPLKAQALVRGFGRDQLWLVNEPRRMYPGKESAAPLLGYVDALGGGAAGLEKVLDDRLAGETHTIMQARDRKDRSVDASIDPARLIRPGRTIRLTLDSAIQNAAEAALDEAIASSRPEVAMAVVMDVRTGAILAMASRPSGNPNDGAARADQELFKNHTAMDQVEPGSVMKPFVVAAAIEEGLVAPETVVDCELGRWAVADKVIKDDHPKGAISVTEVIKYSSNIGTAKVGFKLGAEKMLRYLSDFGYARSTGLGIPGEVRGQMRKADNIRPIELATTSFGQGVTASPVQLVAAAATLANGGVRMQPYLVDAILDRQGDVEEQFEPRVDRRVISEETARVVSRMMETVIDDGGTGTRARVEGYRVAGKTGTAQKVENGVYSPTKRVSSFVGFLPADHPDIAVAVVVDTPTVGSRYGGIVAAPVFAHIGEFAMRYRGVPLSGPAEPIPGWSTAAEDEEHAAEPAKPKERPAPAVSDPPPPLELVADGSGAWIIPDLRGRSMRAAIEAVAPAGVALQIDGYGHLADQFPAPGSRVAPGQPVILRFN